MYGKPRHWKGAVATKGSAATGMGSVTIGTKA
jgi:hypothetical protein